MHTAAAELVVAVQAREPVAGSYVQEVFDSGAMLRTPQITPEDPDSPEPDLDPDPWAAAPRCADRADGTTEVELSPTYTYATSSSVASQRSGNWTLELLGSDGAVLRSVAFAAQTPVADIDPDSGTAVVDVAANDTDAEGDINPNTVRVLVPPSRGNVQAAGRGIIDYRADVGSYDTLVYEICDRARQRAKAESTVIATDWQ